jgi:hypothetical protein
MERYVAFEESFRTWLSRACAEPIPPTVKAFSFNIFEYPETPTVKFGVELIGASSFDSANPDWACDEVWEPSIRRLQIPTSFSSRAWEDCLARTEVLVHDCLESPPLAQFLKQGEAVGIGFVDGGLSLIWRR